MKKIGIDTRCLHKVQVYVQHELKLNSAVLTVGNNDMANWEIDNSQTGLERHITCLCTVTRQLYKYSSDEVLHSMCNKTIRNVWPANTAIHRWLSCIYPVSYVFYKYIILMRIFAFVLVNLTSNVLINWVGRGHSTHIATLKAQSQF